MSADIQELTSACYGLRQHRPKCIHSFVYFTSHCALLLYFPLPVPSSEFTALFVCQFAFLCNFAQKTYTLLISWFALKNKLPSTDFNKWFSVSCVVGQSPAQVSQMRTTNNGIEPKQGNGPARKPGPCQSGYFSS